MEAEPTPRAPDELTGLEVLTLTEELALGRVAVSDATRQPMGLVHGGVYATVAEQLAARATTNALRAEGLVAQAISNQVSFLRPVLEGTFRVEARRRHRGRTTWLWEVDVEDDAGRLCAIVRVTLAVRPPA